MPVFNTKIPDVLIYEPKVSEDERGYFFESYNRRFFQESGIKNEFVQDNQSLSGFGIIRGLHYQLNPHAQAKIVRVLTGAVLDIAVDIRKGSPYFGQYVSIELSAENRRQLYIPRGFAHGFSVLSKTAEIFYKCDNYYDPSHETGINYMDPELDIDWKIDPDKIVISKKDSTLPPLAKATNNFIYGEDL